MKFSFCPKSTRKSWATAPWASHSSDTRRAIFFLSPLLSKQPLLGANLPSINLVSNQIYHRIDGMLLAPSKYGKRQLVMKNRPYSRYPPTMHALYEWWEKSNVTWYFRGQTKNKICQFEKSRSALFILSKRNDYLMVLQNVRRYFSVVALTIIGMAAVYFHGSCDL